MNKEKLYKQIFSLRLAGFLMLNGFPIKRIHHNLKVKNKDVYLFEDTPELTQAMLEYNKIIADKGEKYADFNKRSNGQAHGKSN